MTIELGALGTTHSVEICLPWRRSHRALVGATEPSPCRRSSWRPAHGPVLLVRAWTTQRRCPRSSNQLPLVGGWIEAVRGAAQLSTPSSTRHLERGSSPCAPSTARRLRRAGKTSRTKGPTAAKGDLALHGVRRRGVVGSPPAPAVVPGADPTGSSSSLEAARRLRRSCCG